MPSATIDRRRGLTADKGVKAPVDVATLANIVLSGEQTIDGLLTASSRVLVKNQTDATTNGFYDSNSGPWTRCIDSNGNGDLVKGQLVAVTGGGQVGTYWHITSANPITLGSSAIVFTQDLGSAVLAASSGSSLVGFIQASASALARTLQSKGREQVSVQDFGAVGDGNIITGTGTDNSAFFQAAINSLVQTGGGALYIPAGVYKLVSQITVPDGVSIVGAGRWSSILLCSTAFSNAGGLINLPASGLGIAGFPTTISEIGILAAVGGCTGNGLVSHKNGFILRGIWVNGFNTGVQISSTDNFLSDFVIEICTTGVYVTESNVNVCHGELFACPQGVLVENSASVGQGTVSITGVRASQCSLFGFGADIGAKNIQITGCSADHVNNGYFTIAGVLLDTVSNVSVTGFVGRLGGTPSTTGIGVKMNACTNVTVSGALVTGWFDGIQNVNGSGITITGCNSYSNGRRGIYAISGDQIVITGNRCSYNGTGAATDAGIYSDNVGGFSQHVITGNNCSQGGGGAQEYGIFASVSLSSAFTVMTGNLCKFNNTSDISVNGVTANITNVGNNPASSNTFQTVASAAAVTLNDVDSSRTTALFNITGTTNITSIVATGWAGRTVVLFFAGILTVTDGSNLKLAGNFVTTADDTMTLVCDGTNWYETARSVN